MTWCLLAAAALAGPPVVPEETRQLLLVVVPTASDSHGTLTRWERDADGWQARGAPVPVRTGAAGVAWGRGLHPPQSGLQKVEGDDRSPEGVFLVGDAFGDAPALAARWPYHPVTPRDLWYEDPASPQYNTHVVVPGERPLTSEEAAAVMRHGDPAHALKLFVAHNAAPDVVPGAGSAIFVHVWRRNGAPPTAGCTAMARPELEAVLAWLDPAATPVFALVTAEDLARLGPDWDLPRP